MAKTKRRKKSPPKKTIRHISETQYVTYRSVRSGKQVKYRRGIRLIAEVRSKKSKKVVGYLNKFTKPTKKNGRQTVIIPRKFGRTEISLKTRKEVENVSTRSVNSFDIAFNRRIIDQVGEQRDIIGKIQKEIRLNDEVLIQVRVTFPKGTPDINDGMKMYTKKDGDYAFMVTEISIRIINLVRSEAIRTSPKKYREKETTKAGMRKNWNYYRKAKVSINFGRFE